VVILIAFSSSALSLHSLILSGKDDRIKDDVDTMIDDDERVLRMSGPTLGTHPEPESTHRSRVFLSNRYVTIALAVATATIVRHDAVIVEMLN